MRKTTYLFPPANKVVPARFESSPALQVVTLLLGRMDDMFDALLYSTVLMDIIRKVPVRLTILKGLFVTAH